MQSNALLAFFFNINTNKIKLMQKIRTLSVKKLGLYISLSDVAKLLGNAGVIKNETKKDATWLWNTKIKLAEEYLKQLKDGETDNYTELINLDFNDSFIHYSKIDEILPKSNHDIINKLNRQFGFMNNCADEISFEEKHYTIEEHLLTFLKPTKNRLSK